MIKIGRCSLYVVMNTSNLSTDLSTAIDTDDHTLLHRQYFLGFLTSYRCSPPFLDIPSQGHLQSPILLPFLRMSLFLRVLPMESFSFFILSLEDLLYLLAYKRPNLFLSFRLIQYTHVLPSWLNIP